MTPCAISSHPLRISIHSCSGTEAGSQAVPDPSCGEGNCKAECCPICMFIPLMDVSCADAISEAINNNVSSAIEYTRLERNVKSLQSLPRAKPRGAAFISPGRKSGDRWKKRTSPVRNGTHSHAISWPVVVLLSFTTAEDMLVAGMP